MELSEKIADYKKRALNKSLPASAVAVLEKKIKEMEEELSATTPKETSGAKYAKKVKEQNKPKKKANLTFKEAIAGTKGVGKSTTDYDCDELIEKEKARKAASKKSAAKSENTPVVKKDEKAINTLIQRIKKHYKEGDLSREDIAYLSVELLDILEELKKLHKSKK